MLTDLYGAHQAAWPVGPQRVPDPRLPLVDVHPGVPVGLARHEPGAVGGAAVAPERRPRSCRRPTRSGGSSRRPSSRGDRSTPERSSSPRRPACDGPSCVRLRRQRDVDWERRPAEGLGVDRRPQGRPAAGDPDQEPARSGPLALDELTLSMLRAQVDDARAARRARRGPSSRRTPTCSPTTSTARCRGSPTPCRSTSGGSASATGLDHLDFHNLRKFMETYGQEMGYSRRSGRHAGRSRPGRRRQALQRTRRGDRPGAGPGSRIAPDTKHCRCAVTPTVPRYRTSEAACRHGSCARRHRSGSRSCAASERRDPDRTRCPPGSAIVIQVCGPWRPSSRLVAPRPSSRSNAALSASSPRLAASHRLNEPRCGWPPTCSRFMMFVRFRWT